MANIFMKFLTRRVADKYYNIKKLTKQLHKTASTIGFIKKSLHNKVIPTFAKVKGTFLREEHQRKCEEDINLSYLQPLANLLIWTFGLYNLNIWIQFVQALGTSCIHTTYVDNCNVPACFSPSVLILIRVSCTLFS